MIIIFILNIPIGQRAITLLVHNSKYMLLMSGFGRFRPVSWRRCTEIIVTLVEQIASEYTG